MKLYILYHPNDEFARITEEFKADCIKHTDKTVEMLDVDSQDGSALVQLYDAVSYPAILVVRDDGQLYKGWQGSSLPTVNEVISNLNV